MTDTPEPEQARAAAIDRLRRWPAIPQIWLVAGGGWAGRAIQVVCQLLSVRILTESLGSDNYGVFAVLTSLVGWLALSDFCVAASLQNFISERRAAQQESDDLVLTAALLALINCCATALLLTLAGPWLAKLLLGEFNFLTAAQATTAFYAMAFPGIGTALGGILYKFWLAHHRGYLASLVPAVGTMLGTLAVWLAARLQFQPILPWSIALFYGPLAVVPVTLLAIKVIKIARHRPHQLVAARPILARGLRFWLFGLLSAGVLQVDYVIMAQVLPPQDIVVYNIASKLFGLVFFVYTAVLTALWPVCSEHIYRREWPQVFSAIRTYGAIGMLFVCISGIGILLTAPMIVSLISPTLDITLPTAVIILLTLYNLVRIWTDTFGMVLQSMNDLKIFWIAVPIQSLLSIGLQIVGAHLFGLPGMITGLALCFILTVGWILPLRCRAHARAAAAATAAASAG